MDAMHKNSKWQLIYGDDTLGVSGDDRFFLFSYSEGGAVSMVIRGREWIYRKPCPALWRATTDNDRGCRFHFRSGIWMAADSFLPCIAVKLRVDGNSFDELPVAPGNNDRSLPQETDNIEITFQYKTITTPAAIIEITYSFKGNSIVKITAHYSGTRGLPELPVFGIRFTTPMLCTGYTYEGLSGETYPDRMAGGVYGIYKIDGLPVTPYLVPQDCGLHMQNQWVEIEAEGNTGRDYLCLSCEGEPFAFSCLPYTPQELENAMHQEELPTPRRTVLTIYGKVRGVGGIDSWGSEPEETYRISGEGSYQFSFCVM